MGSSVFTIGLSGLKAANLGLTTAGHNIANVNTAGYSRQTIQQSAPYPALSGSGYVGLGVRVDTITRSYDQFLTRQVQTTQAKASYYETYSSHIAQIDNLVADSSAGVSPAIQDYFSAVQNVATNPSNLPARETLLSTTQTMINRFQSVNQQLADQRTALNGEITNAVANINSYAKQIADLNQQIVLSSGTGVPPNDLLDQRDQMVKDLNTLVKASTVEQSDGSINVFIGTGQNLVVGGTTFELQAVDSPADPQVKTVAYVQNGNTIYLPENSLGGGELGALLDFRTTSLNLAQNNLAMVAMGITQMLNTQQQVGMDLNGNQGESLFGFNSTLVSGSISAPALGYAVSNAANSGTAELSGYIEDIGYLQPSDYELAYDGNYTLKRISDSQSWTFSSLPISQDGLVLDMTGTPNIGDRFTIKPYEGFIDSLSVKISDPREIAAASLMRVTTDTGNTGSVKLTQPVAATPLTTRTDEAVNSALTNPVTIVFTSSSSFTVTDASGSVTKTYSSGDELTFNGWSLTITGQPAVGDRFTIGSNVSGTEDGSNAMQMAALQTTKFLSKNSDGVGTASFEQSYSQMVAKVGTQTSEVSIMAEAQATMLSQAEAARDSVSGVNLDEEAASLLRYQQAYIAASKLIQIAQQAFEEIANIV